MRQRDIILTPFPFSDQSGRKVRPALIISNNRFNQSGADIIICAITATIKPSRHSIIISQQNLEDGTLYETSAIKVETILKLQKSLVLKKIATINTSTFTRVTNAIAELFRPS